MIDFDVIVVGGGHAGIEASFSSSKMGMKTLLISLNKKMIGNMPCNPSIGGSAKGVVVREIDALGGMMGSIADKHYLQMKMLNTGKGPGVQCLRAQEDKLIYPRLMQEEIDKCPDLFFYEGMVTELLLKDGFVNGVKLSDGQTFTSKAVILATGPYMESDILIGHKRIKAGPDGEKPSLGLSIFLNEKMGIEIYRLKTGTPPRLKKSSIDFSVFEPQLGGPENVCFSYETNFYIPLENQVPCWLCYTNEKTHNIIRSHLLDSSMYGGMIKSKGPRYCPSIETKVVTFSDKERHQLFLEPETRDGESIYLQGFSTSMPEEVQIEMVHSIVGLEKAEFLKYAYAIEYDAIKSFEYDDTLMIKKYPGLYVCGQIVGTSGYEEAAALGLMAGINAALRIKNLPKFVLKRDEAYIGVMIDDLVTKGTDEPYRLMSSRAEYRLVLRHDNADLRLTDFGHDLGLINEERYTKFTAKRHKIDKICELLRSKRVKEKDIPSLKNSGVKPGMLYSDYLKLANISLKDLFVIFKELYEEKLTHEEIEEIEIILKYEGYINNQMKQANNMRKLESLSLPKDIDYLKVEGLALEARDKLNKFKPSTIGQASRISGVNPSDIGILIMRFKK